MRPCLKHLVLSSDHLIGEKEKFLEEVDFMGASMSVTGSGAFASSLSRYFPRVLELLADAVLNPLLTQEEFEKAKKKLLDN